MLADAGRDDWVLCQITSQSYADDNAISISDPDFANGSLIKVSYARTAKLFTANSTIITKIVGELKPAKTHEILDAVRSVFVQK